MADGSWIATSGEDNGCASHIWKSIAQITPNQLIAGYSKLIQEHIDQGFNGYFLSFMYRPLAGSPKSRLIQMNDEVQRVYSTFVTRVVRNPRSETSKASLPFLITVPDRPVPKERSRQVSDLKINNGLHLHGILCAPWTSRLKVNVTTYFKTNEALYVKNRLLRIDVKSIYSADVVDYAFKSLKNGNAASDDIQVYR
jgi:hypothetical protein